MTVALLIGVYLIGVGAAFAVMYDSDSIEAFVESAVVCLFWPLAVVGAVVFDLWSLFDEAREFLHNDSQKDDDG